MRTNSEFGKRELLKKLLYSSYRISSFSPAMKPFIRFGGFGKPPKFYRETFPSKRFWNFDYLLEKKIISLLYTLAYKETIVKLCIEQWENNSKELCRDKRRELKQAKLEAALSPLPFYPRMEFLAKRLPIGGRVLYIGCGTGKECFYLAKRGFSVMGIDTNIAILNIAKQWSAHLGYPAHFIGMDAYNLGFKPGTFDAFLFEFYGTQPSPEQNLTLQRNLVNLLKRNGRGFIVANRKQYCSRWYLMKRDVYPSAMVEWLLPQSALDGLFATPKDCEERLLYGLYFRTHTVESLSSELNHAFKVKECLYDQDPRYVLAVVSPKSKKGDYKIINQKAKDKPLEPKLSGAVLSRIQNTIFQIETLCDLLERHALKLHSFFKNHPNSGDNCLRLPRPNMPRFIKLLTKILK